MHVNWVEADRVLSVVHILTESWKTVGFIYWSSESLGVDDISRVTKIIVITIA